MTLNQPLEEQHQLHLRQGLKRPDCPLCWRDYHRYLLTMPRLPVVPYSYETVYRLAPGKIVLDEQWHPHIIASVEKQPGGDYGVQYAVLFEDGERQTYQLQELIHFLCGDREHLLDVYTSQGHSDALADAAMLERSYEEAALGREASAHLDRYQQRLKQSEAESDRAYYRAYSATWTSQIIDRTRGELC